MAIAFIGNVGRLIEVAFARETVYGTYLTPSVANGGVQPVFGQSLPRWGRGMRPIEGLHATGTTQPVVTYRGIRGNDFPFVEVELPYGPDTQVLINELISGSTLAANAWAINDFPNSYSVCVNQLRSGGAAAWNFAGCYAESVSVRIPVGQEASASIRLAATSLVDPQSAVAMPALTPTTASGPFLLKGATLKHSATDAFVGSAIPVQDIMLSFTRGLKITHASGSTQPHHITPATFGLTGTINAVLSSDWLTEFQDIIAKQSDGGYTTRYLDLVLLSGSTTQRFTIPAKLDCPSIDGSGFDEGTAVPLSFVAGGDDATPTVATARIKNA